MLRSREILVVLRSSPYSRPRDKSLAVKPRNIFTILKIALKYQAISPPSNLPVVCVFSLFLLWLQVSFDCIAWLCLWSPMQGDKIFIETLMSATLWFYPSNPPERELLSDKSTVRNLYFSKDKTEDVSLEHPTVFHKEILLRQVFSSFWGGS